MNILQKYQPMLFSSGLSPAASFDLRTSLPSGLTFTRASTAWFFNASGVLTSASTNIPRFDTNPATLTNRGLLLEEARTNQALWSRDATNAAWVKTNCTAALTQTGLDNAANTASLLTASAANGTSLQTITQAAANSVFSVYLRRVTGTGGVDITQDGGTTWTPVTLTGSWQRFACPVQSTLNPVFGIRIQTSGDAVAMDVAQFEAGTYATSAVLTTTASVARAQDLLSTTTIPWFNPTEGSFTAECFFNDTSSANLARLADFSDGTANNLISLFRNGLATQISGIISVATVTQSNNNVIISALTPTTLVKAGFTYRAGAATVAAQSATSSGTPAAIPSGLTTLTLGNLATGARNLNGWLRGFSYYRRQLTAAQMAGLTT